MIIRGIVRGLVARNKALLIKEAGLINGFFHLLFRPMNTGERWSAAEKKELKGHLRHLSFYVPVLVIFLLPGGSFLLPFLAEVLDRRKTPRPPPASQS
jgi:hypothetical protein